MTQPITPQTPSEQLAEKILVALEAAKFVLPADTKKIANNLASGKLRAEDWRLVIEKAIDKGNAS